MSGFVTVPGFQGICGAWPGDYCVATIEPFTKRHIRICCRRSPYVWSAIRLGGKHGTGRSQCGQHQSQRTGPGANARARAGELQGTRSLYLPSVDAFGELGYEDSTLNGSSRNLDFTASAGVEARLTLFDGYARANQVYRNAARLDESLYNALFAASTVALNAVEAYVDVVRHRQLRQISRLNIQRHKDIRKQIIDLVEGGKSPVSDQFQIDERLLAARAVEEDIEKALADARAKYERIIGSRPGSKMHIGKIKQRPKTQAALIHSAVANNVAIKRGTKAVAGAGYALEGERAALRPKLFLKGRVQEGNDASSVSNSNREAFLGLQLSWSLYDGGASRARRSTLSAERMESEFRRDALVREVAEIAGKAWNAYASGSKRYSLLLQQEKAAARIVDNYREEYGLSKRSLLDVLDAERARFNTGFQRISAYAAFRFSEYRMLAVQSRLVDYFGAKPAVAVAKPDFEERVSDRPLEVFNVTIDPLR